jgi:LPPG:FO 2-phospho-L-lactate transferase
MGALARYERGRPTGSRAGGTWFGLGDKDLATHLYRTARLAEGAPLSAVVGEIAAAWGIGVRLLPMSDDRVQTMVTIIEDHGLAEVGFQDYFVGRHHSVPVASLRFAGAGQARPAAGVLEAIEAADVVVISPSNPLVSIAPIRAVPGIEAALRARRDRVVAVSPIIAGAALKGPADRMLGELGHEVSVVGVARVYAGIASTLVVDEADADLAGAVESEGLECVVVPTVMKGRAEAAALARIVVGAR